MFSKSNDIIKAVKTLKIFTKIRILRFVAILILEEIGYKNRERRLKIMIVNFFSDLSLK